MNFISGFIKKLTGGDAGSRVMNDNDKRFVDMAKATFREVQTENDKFYQDVIHSSLESDRVIPVNAVLYRKNFIKVTKGDDMQKLLNAGIGTVIGNIANSNTSEAIGGVLDTLVAALLGNTSMAYKKKVGYTLSIGKLGGVERVDFMFASRTTLSTSFATKMEHVLSGVFIVSSCDVEKMSPNDACVLVQHCFKTEPLMVQLTIKSLLMVSLDKRYTQRQKRELQKPFLNELKSFYEFREKNKRAVLPQLIEERQQLEERPLSNPINEMPDIKNLPQPHPEDVTATLGF